MPAPCRLRPIRRRRFDWESAHLFNQGWVCVGRADELANAGDQRAFRIGKEGILVVRGNDGQLRGFYNTCRHRGHELLEPGTTRNLRAIKCPYHAWVYSRGFHQGPFAGSEDEVHIFMAMVAQAYVDGYASKPPQVHAADAASA